MPRILFALILLAAAAPAADREGKVTAEALGTRHEEEFLSLLRRAGLK